MWGNHRFGAPTQEPDGGGAVRMRGNCVKKERGLLGV